MTLITSITLFFAMMVSALIPGPSVMAVVSRSISSGVINGLMVIIGILAADYIFIMLALSGLSAVSMLLGEFAVYVKYVGASYLVWLAYVTWKADNFQPKTMVNDDTRLFSNSAIGLLIGMSNPKAILFYMGFFPAFIELSHIDFYDFLIILLIETCAVGGVLAVYACAGSKARYLFDGRKARFILNKVSGTILASCGAMLVFKS